jgi:hypothetical protein
MITFELFDKIISSIKEQDKIDQDVGDALELLCDSWVMMNGKNKKYLALSELLKAIMQDDGDWISWWIYEDVEKAWWDKKNKKYDLSTTKKLYDFLIDNKKRRLKNKDEKVI